MAKESPISKIKVPFFIIAFAYFVIELFAYFHNIRTEIPWIIITALVLSILFIFCTILSKNKLIKLLYFIYIFIYWIKLLDTRIYFIIYGLYSLISLILSIRQAYIYSKRNIDDSDDSVYLVMYSMFSILIVLMQFIHISVISEKYILKLLMPTLVISLLILGVFIYFAVKNNKGVKVTIKEIGLFAFGYVIIGFMVLMTLLTTNYLYDFKEPEYLTVQVLEYRHHSGGTRSPGYYTVTVEIDGEKEKLKVYDSYIEKIEVNDYINIKVYQGLFNLKYTHVDESF